LIPLAGGLSHGAEYHDTSGIADPGGEHGVLCSSGNTYKFTHSTRVVRTARSGQDGKERDAETGFDYLMARYYSSAFGRFACPDELAGGPVDAFSSNDPIPPGPLPYADITNPQSLNKYAYVHNNPLRFIDPTGPCDDNRRRGDSGRTVGRLPDPENFRDASLNSLLKNPLRCQSEEPEATRNLLFSWTFLKSRFLGPIKSIGPRNDSVGHFSKRDSSLRSE